MVGGGIDQDEFGSHGHDQNAMIISDEAGVIAETFFVEFPNGLKGAGVEAVNLFAAHTENAIVGDNGCGGVGSEVITLSFRVRNDLAGWVERIEARAVVFGRDE